MTRSLLLFCALIVTGCPSPAAPTDAATGADASALPDTGAPLDADAPRDSGVQLDAALPTSAAELVDAMASLGCDAAFHCALADLDFTQRFLSRAQCLAVTRGRYGELLASPDVAFDASMASACLMAFDDAVCASGAIPSDTEWPDACRAALHGTVAAGAACTRTAECAAGVCTCAGRCALEAQLGQACTAAPCARGLRCDATGVCATDTSARPGLGQACGAAGCEGALRCSAGTCHEVRDLRRAALGDACVNPFDFSTDVDPARWCAEGLFCDYDHGSVCAANPGVGEPCVGQGVCPEGHACQGSPLACAPVQLAGGDCFDPAACVADHVCLLSVCEAMRGLGQSCSVSEQCYSGRCGSSLTCELPERAFCP